jgi:elongator complex protein 1
LRSFVCVHVWEYRHCFCAQIIFFERNGLRHGEFTLPPPPFLAAAARCVQIEYNCDSELMALLLHCDGDGGSGSGSERQSWVLVYTHSNGHHYLKWSTKLGAIIALYIY